MPNYIRYEDMPGSSQQITKENGGVSFQCLMLTSTNYTTWAIKMEAIMDAHGVWESIETPVEVIVDEKKNKMARV